MLPRRLQSAYPVEASCCHVYLPRLWEASSLVSGRVAENRLNHVDVGSFQEYEGESIAREAEARGRVYMQPKGIIASPLGQVKLVARARMASI